MPRVPPTLPDELVEEFLLRLPPEDPASLVHAALVCKSWRRVLADRGFHRRFSERHHRRPPMLGYFRIGDVLRTEVRRLLFTPTSSFRPRAASLSRGYALDSRHGRVLLRSGKIKIQKGRPSMCGLAVWDPITDDLIQLPSLPRLLVVPDGFHFTYNAAVLCASNDAGCDHLDCHRGPFLVVLIGAFREHVNAYVYSSQAGRWSLTADAAQDPINPTRLNIELSVLAGNALYFRLLKAGNSNGIILKYDLSAQEISSVLPPIHLSPTAPTQMFRWGQVLLTTTTAGGANEVLPMTTESGGLGIAIVDKLRLRLWSMEDGPDGVFGWTPSGVINLDTMLPRRPHGGFVVPDIGRDYGLGGGAIVIRAHDGVYSFGLKYKLMAKLSDDNCTGYFVPYVSFCTPALGAAFTREGTSAGVSKCKKI